MQVTGVVEIKVDGQVLLSNEAASLTFGGFTRTPIIGNRFHGFSKKPVNAEIECTISHRADTDVIALSNLENATVTFETDTGKTYLVSNAFTMDVMKLTGGQGELTFHLSGNAVEEI